MCLTFSRKAFDLTCLSFTRMSGLYAPLVPQWLWSPSLTRMSGLYASLVPQWLWSPSPVAGSPGSGSRGIRLKRLGQNCIRLKQLHTHLWCCNASYETLSISKVRFKFQEQIQTRSFTSRVVLLIHRNVCAFLRSTS